MGSTMKTVLAAVVTLGVFGLCGLALYKGEMSITAAMATCMASLSSAGVLTVLFRSPPAQEEDEEE